MPEPEETAVTNAEDTAASEQVTPETQEEQVTQPTSEVTEAGTPAPVETTPKPVQPAYSAVDEHGIPWQNRAMEATRKFEQMPDIIKQTVQEALQTQQQQPKYTKENIPQLRQYALDHPEYSAWVENTIEDIRSAETAKVVRESLSSFETKQRETALRQQSEAYVTNHPEFKECFSTDPFGNKVWNMSNPLTQIMSQILNQPDPTTGRLVKDRPDGLAIAAELAYGRYALSLKSKTATQVNQLKRDLRKVQKQTVTQAGGVPSATPSRSPVRKHLDNYSKTYSSNDIKSATKAYLAQVGLIKEE